MVWILTTGALLVSSLFGASTLLDKIDDIQDPKQVGLINLGSFTFLIIGGVAVWYVMRGKK